MNLLNFYFNSYDKLIASLSPHLQILAAFVILFILIGLILAALRHGHWIFIVLLVLIFPSVIPVIKIIWQTISLIVTFLITRIAINL